MDRSAYFKLGVALAAKTAGIGKLMAAGGLLGAGAGAGTGALLGGEGQRGEAALFGALLGGASGALSSGAVAALRKALIENEAVRAADLIRTKGLVGTPEGYQLASRIYRGM